MELKTRKPKIGFALSGGGARAAAHIGILKALEEQGIKADVVAGTSGGAIAGALYAGGVSIDQMMALADRGSILKLLRPGLPIRGLTNLDYLANLLEEYLGKKTFEELDIPLFVIASNLLSGQMNIFESGALYSAVMASCAVPLIFKPIEIDGQLYADGGTLENLPVTPLEGRCDVIIGMNVMPVNPMTKKDIDGMIAIGKRIFEMSISSNTQQNMSKCDIVIELQKITKYGVFNFSNAKDLVEIGYERTLEQMDDILEIIKAAEG